MKFVATLLICLALLGCGHNPPAPAITINKTVEIAKEALEPCVLLQDSVITSFEDVLVAYGDLATKYGICASKQNTSITLLKQFGNIK